MNKTLKDPVCHMEVSATSFPIEYAGIHYAFCSAQCKERFQANPHLYTGFPGKSSPAQKGKEVIKQRCMVLSDALDAEQSGQVERELLEMMGIRSVRIDGNRIEIQYDLMQVTVEQIASKLALIGAELGGGWMGSFKLAFINYFEECEIDSLEVEDKKCCNR